MPSRSVIADGLRSGVVPQGVPRLVRIEFIRIVVGVLQRLRPPAQHHGKGHNRRLPIPLPGIFSEQFGGLDTRPRIQRLLSAVRLVAIACGLQLATRGPAREARSSRRNWCTQRNSRSEGQAFLRSSMELPLGLSVGAALRWVDALHIDNGPTGAPVIGVVPLTGSSTPDLRGWRRATSRYPLSARTCYASTR
jgi:hypothetical protein